MSVETVRMLIAEGHLLTTGQDLWRGGICPRSLDEVCARYVATDRLVHSFGCHPRSIARRLTDAGVAVLKVGRDAIGLALRSDVDALFPCDDHSGSDSLGTMPEAERRMAELPRVRRWREPRIATAEGGFRYTAITKRVTALLRLGETVDLTVDCCAKASLRRYRIVGLVESVLAQRLPGFVMVREGEGHCVLRSTCPPEAVDEQDHAARDRWLVAALDALADVFTLVGTEARLRDFTCGRLMSQLVDAIEMRTPGPKGIRLGGLAPGKFPGTFDLESFMRAASQPDGGMHGHGSRGAKDQGRDRVLCHPEWQGIVSAVLRPPMVPGKPSPSWSGKRKRLHLENSLLEIDEEELDEFPDEYGLVIVLKDGLSHEYSFHDGDGNYDEDAQTQRRSRTHVP